MQEIAMKVTLLLATFVALVHARTLGSNITTIGVDECPQDQTRNWTVEWIMRHDDCNKFYICVNGEPVEMRCYGNLYFNLTSLQCDWPENVDCEGRNIPNSEEDNSWNATTTNTEPTAITTTSNSTEGANGECPEDPLIHRLLPHEYDCNLFYYCVWGEKVLSTCPTALYFNAKLQVCDYPVDAGCAVSTTSSTDLEEFNSTLPTL